MDGPAVTNDDDDASKVKQFPYNLSKNGRYDLLVLKGILTLSYLSLKAGSLKYIYRSAVPLAVFKTSYNGLTKPSHIGIPRTTLHAKIPTDLHT